MADPVVYEVNGREFRGDGTAVDGEGTAGTFTAAVLVASVHNVGAVGRAPLSPGELAAASMADMEEAHDPDATPQENEARLAAVMAERQAAHLAQAREDAPEGVLTAEPTSPTAPSVPASAPVETDSQPRRSSRRASSNGG
jgi:hypothetical protein